jgi:hypothetical protein
MLTPHRSPLHLSWTCGPLPLAAANLVPMLPLAPVRLRYLLQPGRALLGLLLAWSCVLLDRST